MGCISKRCAVNVAESDQVVVASVAVRIVGAEPCAAVAGNVELSRLGGAFVSKILQRGTANGGAKLGSSGSRELHCERMAVREAEPHGSAHQSRGLGGCGGRFGGQINGAQVQISQRVAGFVTAAEQHHGAIVTKTENAAVGAEVCCSTSNADGPAVLRDQDGGDLAGGCKAGGGDGHVALRLLRRTVQRMSRNVRTIAAMCKHYLMMENPDVPWVLR